MSRTLDDELSDIFPGASRMAMEMRNHDWAATPLGDPRQWPDALKIPLRMLLTTRFEMWLGWGTDLHFFYNDAYSPTLGNKHPRMLGRPFQEVWSEVYDEVADQVAHVRAGEATWNKALLLLLERNGYPEETYHSFSYSPLYETDGSVGGMLCIVSEETQRIISERRLDTLRQLGMALIGLSDKEVICRAALSALATNRRDFPFAVLRLNEEDAFPIDPLWQRLGPDFSAADNMEGQILALPPGEPFPSGDWNQPPRQAISISLPDAIGEGSSGTLVLGLTPHLPDDPDIINVVRLIAGQIGAALANVDALKAEQRRADRMWTFSRDLMVVLDGEGRLCSVSPAWTEILGHPVSDVIGHYFKDFMLPEDVPTSTVAHGEAMAAKQLNNYRNRFKALDGSMKVIEWHTALEDGLIYAYGRDVTEREQAQRALEEAQEALFQSQKMDAIGQLTGGVAHDFNNLLMAVLSSLSLLRKRIADDPQAERLLDNAVGGAQRGATLTQRMLAFARRQDLTVDHVDLPHLLMGMNDLIQRSIGPEWPISMDLPPDLPAVRADANQLEMAVLNLIVNARDATPSGGPIHVSASHRQGGDHLPTGLRADSYVRLQVSDRGSGMDSETLRRATEPFFTTKGVGKGTGLGLPMIDGMAEQVGGTFEIESELGKGTRAILWLPVSTMPEESAPPAIMEDPPVAIDVTQLNILAVDDDALVLLNTAALLEDMGHVVIEANSGAEALDHIRRRSDIDLVITDHAMPNMTGVELIAAIEQIRPGLPTIIASGYGEGIERPRPDIILLGKPFNQTDLTDAIGRTFKQSAETETTA